MDRRSWNGFIRLGIGKIDEEHAVFFGHLRSLEEAVSRGKAKKDIGRLIDELMLFAYNHFADEEKMLRDFDYPDFERHKKRHEAATERMLEMANLHEEGHSDPLEAIRALIEWLLTHITEDDRKYAVFLASKGLLQKVD
jgi:hemerythrin